jgi:antitoxin CcdA
MQNEDLSVRIYMRIFMRMKPIYDTNAPKKPTNLSINSDLLRQAKELGIGLSAELEARLIERLAERRRQEWEVQVREQVDIYNASVEQYGVFSDGVRGF